MNYYEFDAISHSGCKSMGENPLPESVFEFGRNVHDLMEGIEVPTATPEQIRCAMALQKHVPAGVKREHEFYRTTKYKDVHGQTIWQKAKVDAWLPRQCIWDYKTCTASTESQFITACKNLGYYTQMARYMDMAKVDTAIILGVNKATYKVWPVLLRRNHSVMAAHFEQYKADNLAWYNYYKAPLCS